MPQPPTVSDVPVGEIVKHGSQLVTFNLAGTLVAEDIQWSKGFNSVDFADYSADHINGAPGAIKRSAYSATKAVGSMTVQVKAAGTVIFSGEFVTVAHPGFAPIKFIVTFVGVSYTQNGATKIPIGIAEYMSERQLPSIIALDGDFTQANPANYLPCGPIRFFNPLPQITSCYGFKQKFAVFRSSWQRLALNTIGPGGNSYLVEETELEDTSVANIVTFDRVWVTFPGYWEEKGTITKTRKSLFKQWTNGVLSAVGIGSHSDLIKCDIKHWYYLDYNQIPAIPGVPDVAINSVGVFTWVDAINGFPFNGGVNTPPDTNNFYSFITGSARPWMGKIWELTLIYGN